MNHLTLRQIFVQGALKLKRSGLVDLDFLTMLMMIMALVLMILYLLLKWNLLQYCKVVFRRRKLRLDSYKPLLIHSHIATMMELTYII